LRPQRDPRAHCRPRRRLSSPSGQLTGAHLGERGQGDSGPSPSREGEPRRSRQPRVLGDRPRGRAASLRSPAQATCQDRRGALTPQRWHLCYCAETSEPISLKRLEARPIATLSVEAQERPSAANASIATSESFQFVVGFRSARVLCRPLAVSCPPHTSEFCTINTSGFDFR
jgi:hypothetical protein